MTTGPLFSRVQLSLGPEHSTDSIDQRIKDFANTDDPSLLALYFAFGRYLLISSSRPGGQPANLQGIWNQDLTPPWASKWTTNINLEMNYWQADTGDLWETEQPLWNLIRDLEVTGAETARVQYHANGWVLHHNTDLWRATAPVDGPWGLWPMGSLWLANQMWDHYTFSLDRAFLRQDAYPAMKGAAEFALSFLVEAPPGTPFAGRLVTNPSTSPENAYLLNGKRASLTYAATMDLELIRELFENCRRAARILGTDAAFSAKLDATIKRLPPLQIGKRRPTPGVDRGLSGNRAAASPCVAPLLALSRPRYRARRPRPNSQRPPKRLSRSAATAAPAGPRCGVRLSGRACATPSTPTTT